MEETGRIDAIKGKGRDIGSRLLIITKILIVGLAIFGAFTLVGDVSALVSDTGQEPIYEVSVADVANIMIDTNGDGGFDIQVAVDSLTAFRNIESDQVFLSVTGSLSDSGQ